MTRRRMTFWIAGPLVLIALNFARDLVRLQQRYDWERVERKALHRGVSSPGVMEAARVMEIKSEVEETVEKKLAQEGQAVREGQPLLELSRSRTKLEYEQKKNAHAGVEADYKKAVRELLIQKKLLRSLAVSRQQVEDAEQAVQKHKAALRISSQEMVLVQKKLDSTLVRSPMKGVLLRDLTKVGTALSPGKEILTVGDVSRFIVRTKVDELDIDQVRAGQPVDIVADAFAGKVMQGRVASIATQAERETFAKVEVIIDIGDSRGLTLKHNLSVRVNIVTEDIPEALSVPVRSVTKKEGDVGWIVVRNRFHLLSTRRVKLGPVGGERIQVLSGLRPGERVGWEKSPDEVL